VSTCVPPTTPSLPSDGLKFLLSDQCMPLRDCCCFVIWKHCNQLEIRWPPCATLSTINFLTSRLPSRYLLMLGVFRILALCALYTGRLGRLDVKPTKINSRVVYNVPRKLKNGSGAQNLAW